MHIHRLCARRVNVAAHDVGSVSVEAAMGMLAICFALLVAAWCAGLLIPQLAVGEAARAGVRVAARGDAAVTVSVEVHRLVPEADVAVTHEGADVHVEVSRVVHPPGMLEHLGAVRLSASSYAADETQS
jgi:hypothetical protein